MLPASELRLHIYGLERAVTPEGCVQVEGIELQTLPIENPSQAGLMMSFEALQRKLDDHPKIYFEPDGSLIWTGNVEGQVWQLDGMIYDFANQIQRIEFRGQCPIEIWREWLRLLDWPKQSLVLHLLRPQCFVLPEEIEKLW